jgi:hypothetical protein
MLSFAADSRIISAPDSFFDVIAGFIEDLGDFAACTLPL